MLAILLYLQELKGSFVRETANISTHDLRCVSISMLRCWRPAFRDSNMNLNGKGKTEFNFPSHSSFVYDNASVRTDTR